MKTRPAIFAAATVLWLAVAAPAALAQPNPPTPPANAASSLRPAVPVAPDFPSLALDPNTGQPLPQPAPQWIDPDWMDPHTVLTNISYEGIPLSEVAKDLRERFKQDFDILPLPTTFNKDWGNEILIQLQLRDVRASEVFNAMNLVFDNDRTPVRWELKSNPHGRPLVQLRVLPQAESPATGSSKSTEIRRTVYFVGDLVGDEKSGGMTMDLIIKTITDLWPADFGKAEGVIQFHKEAQLVVVNGTEEEISFVHQTLAALREKAEAARPKSTTELQVQQLNNFIKSLSKIGDDAK